MDAPAISSERCATCGPPGVRTEAWVCGVCDARFTFRGERVLSLDGLDAELAAGGLYCESCDELRLPFERLACPGCSAPLRHIADVLDHHGRERDDRLWDEVPSGDLRRAPCRHVEEQEAVDAMMSIEGTSTTANHPAGMLEPEEPRDGAGTAAHHGSPRSLHVPSEALPRSVNVCTVAIRDIVIPQNRVPDPSVVRQLKTSIADLGLLNPIILTSDGELVAGRNRVAAYAELGYSQIEARIQTWDAIDRELVEIDENLVRRRIPVLERGRLLARRKELYEALHPEARQHARGGHAKAAAGAAETISPAPAFSTDAAAKLGTSERTVQEEIRIANDLAPEAAELILGTPLADEKVKLMQLTRLPGHQQAAVARLFVDGRAKSVKAAVAVLQRSASQTDTPHPKPKSRVERARPGPCGTGGLPSQGEELVTTPAVPQGSMVPNDPADARRLPAPRAEDLASTDDVETDGQELVSIPQALADVRDKLRRARPGRMNADVVSTLRELLTEIVRELSLHEEASTGSG
ncbi:ParB/RepB/Spo0J family partition protein [Sorangium sp. So ce1024]|uniref:ParB/RepB/Spo0J family partition protein n=1 Tax=Sorangium sp. So ce1024 TaxID=3133327 RepID=UPI003EFFBB53